jgi:hypothetical protein
MAVDEDISLLHINSPNSIGQKPINPINFISKNILLPTNNNRSPIQECSIEQAIPKLFCNKQSDSSFPTVLWTGN